MTEIKTGQITPAERNHAHHVLTQHSGIHVTPRGHTITHNGTEFLAHTSAIPIHVHVLSSSIANNVIPLTPSSKATVAGLTALSKLPTPRQQQQQPVLRTDCSSAVFV